MKEDKIFPLGDMPIEEFRENGYKMIDWITDYLQNIEQHPVLPKIKYGDVKKGIDNSPPVNSEALQNVFNDLDKILMKGITHWNHPNFMAYFNSTSSGPGILAELLSAGLNVNGMAWHTCPSATELEEMMIEWFKKIFKLPENFGGIVYDTASTSSMHAIAAAREQLAHLKIREKGMAGRNDIPRLRIYASEQAHFSIDKSVVTLGFGLEGIRKITVDSKFRMIPDKLNEAITEDKKNGWLPCCVVATVGTTSTTSVDDVDEIGTICNAEKIWFHVDAAYAGTATILPEMQWIFKGIEKADSLVINPHKWMFTPIDYSLFFTKKLDVLKRAFSVSAEYLKSAGDEVINYMDYGIQLGRRFRSLKPWFIIRYFGAEGLRSRIREHIRLAKMFVQLMEKSNDFELIAPAHLGVVCFRAIPSNIKSEDELNNFNENLLRKINKSGKLFLSHTKLNGIYILRISISGLRTQEEHVKKAWELIINTLKEIK
ncbi:MAG: amino acid decarboxylase [Ignavibacteria bacterium]|nr:amino acid decarboxylase [Ignavibacteria bacterium]MBT8392672.1 amino acid decarboxylase [Ignavibacteria bacterium]NNJ52083.1 amino acid decarboxylase [Ignavibacteriaceae bacterium]